MQLTPLASAMLGATVLLLAVPACSGNGPVATVCPQSGIIYGLDRMYGQNASGDEVSVILENLDGLCTYGGGDLTMELTVDVVVDAAPGTSVPYFVVITDPAGAILEKANFSATVPQEAIERPVRLREQLVQQITDVETGTSSAYAIYFGLDLPPDIAVQQRRSL